MKKFIYLFVLLCWGIVADAQIDNPPDLQRLLDGKKNYYEIYNIVHNYYNGQLARLGPTDSVERKKLKRQLKMWFRWEFFNSGRLETNGDITNVTRHDFQALDELRTNFQTEGIESAYGIWNAIGPTNYIRQPGGHNGGLGRVNCIAFHPSNANTLYIGVPAGGLWRSTNAGTTWALLTDDIPSIGVSGIVVDPADPNIIYILTGDGDGNDRACLGVMKTTDGGDHWSFTGDFPGVPAAGFRGYKLIMHPTNNDILFVVSDQGIFRTINAGVDWTLEQSGWFTDIEFKPGTPTTMYAARLSSSTPFYRSTNTGDTWSTAGITGVPTNSSRIAIGVSAANSNYVYLLAGPATGTGAYVGVYRSFDSGLDFDLRNNAPNILGYAVDGMDNKHQTTYDLAIEVNPGNVGNVITGGINCWRSTNFGVDFTNATEWYEPTSPVAKYVHADIHNLAYNPLNDYLYVCSDGGVSVSTDHGVNWTVKWVGLQLAMYYTMSNYAADQNIILGGLQDNGTMFKNSSSFTFNHIEGADGYQTLIDYSDPDILYFDENDGLNRSIDGGINVSFTGLNNDSWPGLAMHSTNHNIVFAGRSDGVWMRDFSGAIWTNTGAAGQKRMLTCPSNSARVYAYNGTTLRRTDNTAGSWSPAGPPTHPPSSGQPITDMAVNPSFSGDLYVCVGGYTAGQKVYYSDDAGATWSNISGTLPNAACGAIIVDAALGVYVGTDIGVFYRANGGVWVPFYNGLPKVPVTDLYINESAGTISASTYGRGLWRSDIHSSCAATLVLAGTVAGNRFYEVSDNIVSTHVIEGGEGTEFFYKAGSYVRLDPGFEIKAGNKLKAFIGSCGTGIPTFRMLNNVYGITDSKELIKEPLDISPGATGLIGTKPNNGAREVSFNLPKKQFVQLYYERESDHEIIAWVLRGSVLPGSYKMQLTDEKLKGKGIKLVIRVGDEVREIRL